MMLMDSSSLSYGDVFVYNLNILKSFLQGISDQNPLKQSILQEVPIYTNYHIQLDWWYRLVGHCYGHRPKYRVSQIQLIQTNPTTYPLSVHLTLGNVTRDCKISLDHRQQEMVEQLYYSSGVRGETGEGI